MTRITDELSGRGIRLVADTNDSALGLVSEPLKRRDVYLEIVFARQQSVGRAPVREDVAVHPIHGRSRRMDKEVARS